MIVRRSGDRRQVPMGLFEDAAGKIITAKTGKRKRLNAGWNDSAIKRKGTEKIWGNRAVWRVHHRGGGKGSVTEKSWWGYREQTVPPKEAK